MIPILLVVMIVAVVVISVFFGLRLGKETWTESFNLEECNFSATGRNYYFILEPGYQLTLEGSEGQKGVELIITVLNETVKIGNVETRVVEERETKNGELVEVSRNFFAICTQTNSVFYLGEDVDIYEGGEIVSHEGAWQAGIGDAKAGLMMPGIILLGARYYQEVAPGVAMDRAKILSNEEIVDSPAGRFDKCLKIEETTPLEPGVKEYKFYAEGVGLVRDGDLLLTEYGFVSE
ncbi:MAG: hypothetical protein HXY36_04760 [Chloroflexi bacterium]|nr:hypothetical protein [Chloroflexota bacterium]